jgi:hypothetical protein
VIPPCPESIRAMCLNSGLFRIWTPLTSTLRSIILNMRSLWGAVL